VCAAPQTSSAKPSTGSTRKPVVRTAEHAIDDANPAPRTGSRAVPPSDTIMCPAGDAATRRRLSKALAAQRLLADPRRLAELLSCEVLGRAAAVVGTPLLAIRQAADIAPDAGADAKASVDSVQKVALVLAEYPAVRRGAAAQGRAAAGRS